MEIRVVVMPGEIAAGLKCGVTVVVDEQLAEVA
jgi:hypothetical protein